jgi:EAL domain-containing protein (putative c-di-GMP-specific phosphodiesterase class I)
LAAAREHGVDPERFVLEITEGVLLESTNQINFILDVIRGMGFKTALDDFGTGYSSLSYLCNFSFDKIKIDRSFIHSISKVDSSKMIVKSVVTLGRRLGMDIIAEGIETEFEAVMMTEFGCTELQGYYFSKPIEARRVRRAPQHVPAKASCARAGACRNDRLTRPHSLKFVFLA